MNAGYNPYNHNPYFENPQRICLEKSKPKTFLQLLLIQVRKFRIL